MQLYLTARVGYHVRPLDRLFLEPSIAFNCWPSVVYRHRAARTRAVAPSPKEADGIPQGPCRRSGARTGSATLCNETERVTALLSADLELAEESGV